MHVTIAENHAPEEKAMATVYFETMMRLMGKHPEVMDIESDLGACILGGGDNVRAMQQTYPKQFVNVGIQESNMVGVACGLSAVGKVPFIHTFATFMSRRANDQIFTSGCYAGANVRLVGSDPGIMAAYNGGTHQPYEDVAVLRPFPGLTIIEPTDSVMLEDLMTQLVDAKGMFYLRVIRKNVPQIYAKGSRFKIGKGIVVRRGSDVSIFASGAMVAESLEAAQALSRQGIDAEVIDLYTIKPVDRDLVLASAVKTGAVVTAENHSVIGGLGDAVAAVLGPQAPMIHERVGIADHFGEVGSVDFLKQKYHLTASDIAKKAARAINKRDSLSGKTYPEMAMESA